ncbi:helix-turn-helix domain-containing protein [Streptomyces sp. NPDC001020]
MLPKHIERNLRVGDGADGRQGYDETTVAEIAAAAETGTRTFFGYFAGEEDILFPDSDARARATIAAIADRDPAEGPVDVLLRALDTIAESDADMVSPMAAVRMRLFHMSPRCGARRCKSSSRRSKRSRRSCMRRSPTSWTR